MTDVMRYIPKKKQPGIHKAWHDSDGYWIMIREGWHVEDYFAEHTIHEDTLKELAIVARRIVKG